MVNIFENVFLGNLYSDPEVESIFSDIACLTAILRFETGVAKVQGKLGLIPKKTAEDIQRKLKNINLSEIKYERFSNRDGVIVPELIKEIRQKFLSKGDSYYLHWGVSSQDAIDTARCLQLRDFLNLIDFRLKEFLNFGAEKALSYRYLPITSHTRGQMAAVTSFGAKLASIFSPILNQRINLSKLKPHLLQLSFGGASGTANYFGDLHSTLVKELAKELNLSPPVMPWHNNRERFVELGAILTLITSCFGKFGADVLWMSQSEIQEIKLSDGGKSSIMPYKRNPIIPESLMALADISNILNSAMGSAMIHKNERDGVAWTKEIIILRQLVFGAGVACKLGFKLLKSMKPSKVNIRRNLKTGKGLIFSEHAINYLSNFYKKEDAVSIVIEAINNTQSSGSSLLKELEKITDKKIDFCKVFDPNLNLGLAPEIVEVFCNKVKSENL